MSDLISRQAAIDALDCINGVEEVLRSLPSAQPETEERMAESAQNVSNPDLISRKAAIDALVKRWGWIMNFDRIGETIAEECKTVINGLPSAQPDNQIHLCDSCEYNYPDCPSKSDDVIFGTGKGNDNICACNKYKPSAQPEIIHCSECVYYGRADKRRFYRGYDCLDGRIASIVPDRDFCSRAERREE